MFLAYFLFRGRLLNLNQNEGRRINMKSRKMFLAWFLFSCFCLLCAPFNRGAFGQMNKYNITMDCDFTGPHADNNRLENVGRSVTFAWWNEAVGKKLGINLNLKMYDSRYDPAVIASLWPGIVSGDKPVAHIGLGGPTIAALMARLPNDKIPMFMGNAAYGYAWAPGQWIFFIRPTYVHEAVGFYKYLTVKWNKKKIKVGCINSQGIPAYEEFVTGMEKYAKTADAAVEVVGVAWVPVRPIDITNQVARLLEKEPDVIDVFTNTAHVVETIRALESLKKKIPVRMSSHNGIETSTEALGSMKEFEGCYDSYGLRPGIDHDVEGYRVFMKYKDITKDVPYSLSVAQGMASAIMPLRAIERVAKAKGPANMRGEDVYKSMFGVEISSTDLFGLLNNQYFTPDQPFSAKNLACFATTVKNGKHVLESKDWLPIPPIPKY
jgi:branched-chain amino acid transport system substrate-binding protein